MSQAQVSRLEREAQPTHDLNKLVEWAGILRIPESYLWFRLLDRPDQLAVTSFASTASFGWFGAEPSRVAGRREVGQHDIDIVREMTRAFRSLDNRYGGGHARSTVSSYLTDNV
ncbi:MAG TPA: hypothetical protein VFX16_07730, partial [Pseudonocardiaceae bacterium]|nr:hypothetical protein [Pseudonocardiaceae bacterium]